jgi:hypothetical protein
MNPETWEQAKDVITEALKRVPSERERFVRERCGDPALASEIITLLDAYRDGTNFLDDPPEDETTISSRARKSDLRHHRFDRPRRHGAGVPRQRPRLRRKVALKCVIRSIAGSGERRLRILHEACRRERDASQRRDDSRRRRARESRLHRGEYVDGESLAARLSASGCRSTA